MPTLAFDLGGTFLRCGVIGERFEIVDFECMRVPNVFLGFESREIWREVVGTIGAYADRYQTQINRAPVVVAFPGPVREHRVPLFAPTIAGSEPPPSDLAERLAARTGRAVYLINDLAAAAWFVGDDEIVTRSMVMTVGSGIGSKIFDRSRVIDDRPYAGEIGHVVVDRSPGALVCDCGERGHLGAIASGRGVERLARRLAIQHPEEFVLSSCARKVTSAEALTNEEHLVPAARAGDAWTWGVIRQSISPLAAAIAVATHAFGIERVVVIGGFALAIGPAYAGALTDEITAVSSPDFFECPVRDLVRLAEPDDEMCLRGAGRFAQALQCTES